MNYHILRFKLKKIKKIKKIAFRKKNNDLEVGIGKNGLGILAVKHTHQGTKENAVM
jgi:hypothetical protein